MGFWSAASERKDIWGFVCICDVTGGWSANQLTTNIHSHDTNLRMPKERMGHVITIQDLHIKHSILKF